MTPLYKEELKRQMARFIADKERGISIALFCELAGINKSHFLDVFQYQSEPLTETIQRQGQQGLYALESG